MKTHYYTQDIINICDNKHLTVDEIFEYIAQKYPTAGKSSIYRNVEELASEGVLKKVVGASKKTFFEKTKAPHVHLIDQESGEIFDLDIKNCDFIELPKNFCAEHFDIKIFGKFEK